MTDCIAHAFSDLSEGQALLAQLSEILEMTRQDHKTTKGDALDELIASAGLPEEIEAAGKTMQTTIVNILTRVSERDLEQGREA